MAISDYIAALQKTKTHQAGLISFQEYSFKSKAFGLVRSLPNIPHADEDRHVIVMEIRGDQPNIFTVLKDPKHSITPTTRDADKLLFIFIEMRPHILKIEKSAEGYQLGDGHQINSTLTIKYKVEDAEEFWKAGRDQLAEFETTVIDTAKNFFLGIKSNYLINNPAELKKSLEHYIQETAIKVVKNDLEKSVWESCKIAGIRLINVTSDVYLSDSLRKYLQRIHDKIFEEGGAAERREIDLIIDNDKTFTPYGLRAVITALDIRLLENFYVMKWTDAMRKVTEKLAERKEEYFRSIKEAEINKMKDIIDTAGHLGLDEMDVKDLKDKLAKKLSAMADRIDGTQLHSDSQYLKLITSSPSSADQLTSDATQRNSSGSDDKKD